MSRSTAKCLKCNAPLTFIRLESGKWRPCNPDGTDHFDDCRKNQMIGRFGPARRCVVLVAGDATRRGKVVSKSNYRVWSDGIVERRKGGSWIRDAAYRNHVDLPLYWHLTQWVPYGSC